MKSKGSTAVEILAFSLLTLRQGRVKNDFIENRLQYYFFCIRHRAQMTQTQNKRNEVERIIPHRDIRVLSLRALSSRMAAKTRASPSAPCSVKPAITSQSGTKLTKLWKSRSPVLHYDLYQRQPSEFTSSVISSGYHKNVSSNRRVYRRWSI